MGRIQEVQEEMRRNEFTQVKVQINVKSLWKCLGAEFLGTALLLFLGVGCVLKFGQGGEPLNFTGVALCWGFTVATVAQALGGDYNPAVTLAAVVTGKNTIERAIMYILMQCLGSLAGVCLLKVLFPSEGVDGDWGVTKLAPELSPFQGVVLELISTFVLVFTVFSVSDENRKDVKGSAPLAIGLCVAAIVMFLAPLTGASLNPARSLGSSLVANHFADHWIYWVGPIAGGIMAALLYENMFRALRPDEIEDLEEQLRLRQRRHQASAPPSV